MAPPRTTKASSHKSTTASATRQSNKKARKEIDDMEDDMEAVDEATTMDIDDAEPEEPSSTSAQELIANMVEGQRKRHMSKKRNVVKAYDTTCKDVQESVNTLFDEHERKASSAHKAQLQRLKELLTRKAKLEAAMEAKLTALRANYDAHSRDVENVLSHKIKQLK